MSTWVLLCFQKLNTVFQYPVFQLAWEVDKTSPGGHHWKELTCCISSYCGSFFQCLSFPNIFEKKSSFQFRLLKVFRLGEKDVCLTIYKGCRHLLPRHLTLGLLASVKLLFGPKKFPIYTIRAWRNEEESKIFAEQLWDLHWRPDGVKFLSTTSVTGFWLTFADELL